MNSSAIPSGMHGVISSKGTKVTLYYPEITSVKLNEKAVEVMASDRGWVQIQVPSGTFRIDIVSSHTL